MGKVKERTERIEMKSRVSGLKRGIGYEIGGDTPSDHR